MDDGSRSRLRSRTPTQWRRPSGVRRIRSLHPGSAGSDHRSPAKRQRPPHLPHQTGDDQLSHSGGRAGHGLLVRSLHYERLHNPAPDSTRLLGAVPARAWWERQFHGNSRQAAPDGWRALARIASSAAQLRPSASGVMPNTRNSDPCRPSADEATAELAHDRVLLHARGSHGDLTADRLVTALVHRRQEAPQRR